MTPGELAAIVSSSALLVVAISGVASLTRTRKRAAREKQALGDALAASEAVSAALSEEALFLSAVLSAVDSVIVLFDRGGRVRFVNERFEEVFGVRGADVVGRSRAQFVDAIADGFRSADAFRQVALASDDRISGGRSTRDSGIAAPDESELELASPRHRVLLFSTVPVVQVDRRIGVLGVFRDVTAQRAAEEARERLVAELAARATTDALTGLKNRRAANEALAAEIERARRYERDLAVVLFDLDEFKHINDDFGHEVGDKVLATFGDVMARTARSTDVVARWGGEEFLAILPETDLAAGAAFAERVRAALVDARPLATIFRDNAERARLVTASAGVAMLHESDDADAVVRRADEALYDAKREGRDRVKQRA